MTRSKLLARQRRRKRQLSKAIDRYRKTGRGGLVVRRRLKALRKINRLLTRFPDPATMTTSAKGVDFIKSFEGFSGTPVNIGDGVWTWGFGHADPDKSKAPKSISVKGATKLLARDLAETYEPQVRKLFEEGAPLHGKFTQHLFDALVSVAYNLGVGAVLPYPHLNFETLGAALERGSLKAIAKALPLYKMPGSQFEAGLLRRRRCEARLLLTGNYSTEIL